jgi:hypothetical protein
VASAQKLGNRERGRSNRGAGKIGNRVSRRQITVTGESNLLHQRFWSAECLPDIARKLDRAHSQASL